MKKLSLGFMLFTICGISAKAQLSKGGLPASFLETSPFQNERVLDYPLPDWHNYIYEKENKPQPGAALGSYKFGLMANTDISFPSGGSFIPLANGTTVWRSQVRIDGAPAIGFYYDKFMLPKGVTLFLSNEKQNQILGAYTSSNNTADGMFANEAVQGDLVNIELDIAAGVNIDDIQFHINGAMVYFRSYEYLNKYKTMLDWQLIPLGLDTVGLDGSSSTCHINAICPLGQNYQKQRKSSVQMLSTLGMCTATLVNNTGNTPASCKHYMLAATHCDHDNDTTGTFFSQMLVRFNFEKEQCEGSNIETVHTIVGSKFIAKADYHENVVPINGDFLLMQLNEDIPVSWDAYMAGWDRNTTMPATLTYPKKYIAFHHPSGDVKKVWASSHISPNGTAGGGANTHWEISSIDSGGVAPGSSGSGLFNGDGRLIGIASVGGDFDDNCATNSKGEAIIFGKFVDYAKFSLAWDYSVDGNYPFRKLKPWLDPINSGVMTLDIVKSDCSDATTIPTGISNYNSILENKISMYPNPTTTGIVTARVNFEEPIDLNVEIFNIAGAKVATYHLKKVLEGSYKFDLSTYANGMYMLRFNDGTHFTSKKIMLRQ